MVGCDQKDLTIQTGQEFLAQYRFNTNVAVHHFCKICGIYTFHKMRKNPDKYVINVGCIDGIDLASLQPIFIEGAKIYLNIR